MTGNVVFDYAFKQGLYLGFLLGLAQLFTVIIQTDDWKLIVSSVGLAVLGPLLYRAGKEGVSDAARADVGKTIPSDVSEASDKLVVTKV